MVRKKRLNPHPSLHRGLWYLLAVAFLYAVLIQFVDISQIHDIEYLKATLSTLGNWGMLIFVALNAIAVVMSVIPNVVFIIGATLIWGPFIGGCIVVAGATIGAVWAFLLGRHLGRPGVERLLHKHIHVCNKYSDKHLLYAIFLMRFVPLFNFDMISYAAGLTHMHVRSFIVATILGIIPSVFFVTYFGDLLFISPGHSLLITALTFIFYFLFVPFILYKWHPKWMNDVIQISK